MENTTAKLFARKWQNSWGKCQVTVGFIKIVNKNVKKMELKTLKSLSLYRCHINLLKLKKALKEWNITVFVFIYIYIADGIRELKLFCF